MRGTCQIATTDGDSRSEPCPFPAVILSTEPMGERESYLDARQVQEVLRDVDGELVHEGGRDVEAVHGVVEVQPEKRGQRKKKKKKKKALGQHQDQIED